MHCICICAYFRSDGLLALAFKYIYMCIYIHMYIDVFICIYIHIYINIHVYIYVCIHIHIHTHIHIHIRVDLYACIHKYTLTHTYLLTGDEADGNHLSGVRRFLHVDQHRQRLAQHWQLQINSRYFAQPIVCLCVSMCFCVSHVCLGIPSSKLSLFRSTPSMSVCGSVFLCLFGNPLKETLWLLS